MSRAQQRWILVAAAVAESAWLFAAFGIVGILLMAGLGGGVGSGENAVGGELRHAGEGTVAGVHRFCRLESI